ncbi:MAG: hypothetical protein A3D87_01530 [Omnitrophica WOR_2 bacterium RIFCSPHIGHO2_02_FULL_50_17]|nr:MAG: hypothetical protein A3D87_01530 [Omnitrophica WOR_2 bacterium RIFCSPHIGHO2_02_FULL_50_17]
MIINKLYEKLPLVEEWIKSLLKNSSGQRIPLRSFTFQRLPNYYSSATVDSAKVVLVDKIPVPPLSDFGLQELRDFETGDYAGITYLDTYFIKRQFEEDESLHFHELVHVVQWQMLGLQKFLLLYGVGIIQDGYRESLLEKMAYNYQHRFQDSLETFDVENAVKKELDRINSVWNVS